MKRNCLSGIGMLRASDTRSIPTMKALVDIWWQAVLKRERGMDGVFVYAVRSTGVYCRPVCKARRPRRENVTFFTTPAEATAAGYRPCQRCHPDREWATDPELSAVIAGIRALKRPDAPVPADLAADLGWSLRHFRRMFGPVVGVPMGRYRQAQQAERAREALGAGATVTSAIGQAGYASPRAFHAHGAPRLGMTPVRYRAGDDGQRIVFTIVPTPLGWVLMGQTDRGICAVRIGPDPEDLAAGLRGEFPFADLVRDDDGLAAIASVIGEAARGAIDPSPLPLDLRGTAFQVRVWEALRGIPRGQTRSYAEVAEAIGRPTAVRAVASACAANPAAIVVPCHRVVRKDGSLGGYRWGLDVKSALLQAEDKG